MNALSEPGVEEVVVVKGSQVGWTAILFNIIGYYIDVDPCPMLLLQPTVAMAEAWSKDRFTPTITVTPRLVDKIADGKSRDSSNTILHKEFDGGQLTIVGANAPAELASRPKRIVLCDETERYPVSSGGEGDPMKLAEKRQETFWNRKRLKGSTPVLKNGPILRDYEQSDMRKYHVPCPHCKQEQELIWAQIKWDKCPDTKEHKPETAHYQCESCGELWTDAERWNAVSQGQWVATRPFRGVAGFFMPKFYSPFVTLQQIVEDFLVSRGNPELWQVFVNTVLAEGWEETGETVDGNSIQARAENYSAQTIPDRVVLLTAGVDTQGDRLELQVIGWAPGEESWAVSYKVFHGDPAQQMVWDGLDEYLKGTFTTDTGRSLKIRACCIDTGGHHAAQVYKFCKGKKGRRIYPIKGQAGARMIWPKAASKAKDNNRVYVIGVDTAKDALRGRLGILQDDPDSPKPGFVHFPVDDGSNGFDADYYDQLTAEQVLTRYRNGRPFRIWDLPSGKRAEAWDTFVYALAAREALPVKLKRPAIKPAIEVHIDDTDPAASKQVHHAPLERTREPVRPIKKRRPKRSFNRSGRAWI